jgi:hypothetical protein
MPLNDMSFRRDAEPMPARAPARFGIAVMMGRTGLGASPLLQGPKAKGMAVALSLGCAILAPLPSSAQAGPPAPLMTIGPWIAFCDNTGGCGASNIAAHPGSGTARDDIPGVCLWKGTLEADEASLSLRLDGAASRDGEAVVVEPVSGRWAAPVGPAVVAGRDGAQRYVIRGAALDPLVANLRAADAWLVRERQDEPVMARVLVAQLDRALRAAQSLGQSFRPTPTIVTHPFERVPLGDLKAAALLLHEHCGNDQSRGVLADTFRLGADLQLWSISCRRAGFFNAISLVMTVGRDGIPAPLVLPSVIDHEGAGPDVSNLTIHPDQGVIEDFRKFGGTGDCGIRRRWGWTGTRFELLTEDYMPRCFGAHSSQWLRMHRVNEPGAPGAARPPC